MKIRKLTLKNIRSYKDQEIEFPEGSILLSGDIGSGKTSILLAIEYALFGLQAGQRGSALLSNESDIGSVKLELEINEKEITIERTLKRNSKSISNDSATIIIDGERTESSVTEIKTKILELLNYPIEFIRRNNLLFKYTVYTPQEQMKQIILEDSESRLDVLRHVFGIDKYKRIKENAQRIISKIKEESKYLQIEVEHSEKNKEKNEIKKDAISNLKKSISEKESELNAHKNKRKYVESEVDALETKSNEKNTFQREIEKTQIMITTKRDQLLEEIKEIKEINEKLSLVSKFDNSKLEESKTNIRSSKENIENLNSYLIEVSSKLDSIKSKEKEDLEKKERIFKIDICPTCLQDVSEIYKHNIFNATESQIKKLRNEKEILSNELSKTKQILNKERKNLQEFEKIKSDLEIWKIKSQEIFLSKDKLNLIERNKINLSKDIEFLENHLRDLKTSLLKVSKFENVLSIKKLELRKSFELEKQKEIEIAEIKKEIQLTEQEIEEITKLLEEGRKKKEKLNVLIEMEGWLSTNFLNLLSFTEKSIMTTLRKRFTEIFNKWFSMLTTDSFNVYLDENFTPIIVQGEFELDYSYLSGGERTAVALAYRLALNQIINSILSKINTQDLVILDEPTDGFSENQLDKVRDILQELNIKQLIIVSHEQKIESFVDNIIKVSKSDGHSQITTNLN